MSPADMAHILEMPMAYHSTRFPVQVAGTAGEMAAWVFVPSAQALGERPIVLDLYPGGTYQKNYWHFVPHPQDGSYSFAQAMAEQYRCIVVASDHWGTGESTRPENGFALTLEVLAEARRQVADHIRNQLAAGTLAPGLPRLPEIRLVGIGHSMGALILHRVQARSQPHDAVAFLGWTHGEAQYGPVDQEAVAATLMPNEQGYVEFPPPARQVLRPFFYLPDVSAEIMEADERQATVLPAGMLAATFQPGAVREDAAAMTVPVFLGYGSQDISCNPHQDLACYRQCLDRTAYILGGSAHGHNLAQTRQALWKELGWWLLRRFSQRAYPASDESNHQKEVCA